MSKFVHSHFATCTPHGGAHWGTGAQLKTNLFARN